MDLEKPMNDAACVALLQAELPNLRYRWQGFKRVRRQVCRNIERRYLALGLDNPTDYRSFLRAHPEEREPLRACCCVTISRFYRDRTVFEALTSLILPTLAQRARDAGRNQVCCWSLGCASGEEAYSLNLIWKLTLQSRYPDLGCRILASDVNAHLLRRAQAAHYPYSSLKELPATWRRQAFIPQGDGYCLKAEYRRGVRFECQDLLHQHPSSPFDLILCRNLVFTYFNESLQLGMLNRLAGLIHPGGALLIGSHESLPSSSHEHQPSNSPVKPWPGVRHGFQKALPDRR